MLDKIDERLAVYRAKRDKADPFADDSYNRHEVMQHTVEALEILRDAVKEGK